MRSLRQNRKGYAFALLLFFCSLVFFAVLWFAFYSEDGWVTKVVEASEPIHATYGSDQHPSYSGMVSFLTALRAGILVLTLIVLVIAGLVYAHRKQAESAIFA